MKYARKILSGLTALSVFVSMSMPTFATSISAYEYDPDLPLGIATDFHMFIHNDAELNAHCFGNIAVGNLTSVNSTFGQAYVDDDASGNRVLKNDMVNYVKNLSTNLNITFYGDPFVFGKDAEISITDNGHKNKATMNGFSTTELSFSDCTMYVEDESTPFINLDKEFNNLKALSKEYADAKNSSDVQTSFDMNSAEIKVLTEGVNVKNLKFTDTIAICNNAIFNVVIDNLDKTTLVVNVDMAGAGNEVSVPVRTRLNGQGNKERCDTENSKILWNFYDSSKKDQVYNGTLNFPNEWVGSIMAPGAKVNLYSNFDGTLIADSCSIKGESHSWYYSGSKPEDEATTKATTEPTTASTSEPTTASTTEPTTVSTTEPTTASTTEPTTASTTEPTTVSTEVTTTPESTTTSEVTTTPESTTTTSEVTTTTVVNSEEVTTTVATSIPLVTIPENPTPEQIRRTLAYIDELLKRDDLTDEQRDELNRLRRTLALMINNVDMVDTGTDDGKSLPVVLGGLFLALGVYGFISRRKLLNNSKTK